MKALSVILTVFALTGAFTYGVCVGRYKLPPYYSIKRVFRSFGDEPRMYSTIYLDRTSFFERNGRPAEVVMVGDSITSRAEWQELLPGLSVANRGIEGDTTSGILKRTGSIFSGNPRIVLLMAGINDIGQGVQAKSIVENISKFIDVAEKHRARVVVQSILLTSNAGGYAGFNKKVGRVNAELAGLCRDRGVPFIDVNTALENYRENRLRSEYTNDGIHLNGAGYGRWSAVIAPRITAMLVQRQHQDATQ